MALLGADDIVAADPAVAVAALAELGVLFVQRNALACLGTVGVDAETDGIRRRRLGLDALDRLADIAHQLIDAADDDHALGAVEDRGDAVGIAVDVVQLAVFSQGVGAREERVGAEGLTVDLLDLLTRDTRTGTVEIVVIRRSDDIVHAGLLQGHGTAAGDGVSGLDQCFDQRTGFFLVLAEIRLHLVAAEILHGFFDSGFEFLCHSAHSLAFFLL